MDFLKKNVSWTQYKGFDNLPISGKYLNQIHNKYVKNNIYEEINRQLLNKYLSTDREKKLKYQCIDSTFIANKGGSVKLNNHLLKKKQFIQTPLTKIKKETFIDNNRYNGRKKYFKMSTITDQFGIPFVRIRNVPFLIQPALEICALRISQRQGIYSYFCETI